MTSREASDAEMLAAVERWARATGRVASAGESWRELPRGSWRLSGEHIWQRDHANPKLGRSWLVDAHTRLIWALSVEAGVTVTETRSEVVRMPRQVGPVEHPNTDAWWQDGWTVTLIALDTVGDEVRYEYSLTRIREAARLVLDAALTFAADVETAADFESYAAQGKPAARAARTFAREVLHVEADRRNESGVNRTDVFWSASSRELAEQGAREHIARLGGSNVRVIEQMAPDVGVQLLVAWDEPDPLGLWLALWLAGKREGTADAVERLAPLSPDEAAVDRGLREFWGTTLADANARR